MRTFVLVLVTFFAVAAIAQEQVTEPIANHASEAEVRQLFSVMHLERTQRQMMQSMVPAMQKLMSESFSNMCPNMTDKDREFLDSVMKDAMGAVSGDKYLNQVLEAAVPVYRDNLSSDEVQAMIGFYGTPTGQRILEVIPTVTQQMMARMTPVLQEMMKTFAQDETAKIQAYVAQKKKEEATPTKAKS